jgi:regulatory protein
MPRRGAARDASARLPARSAFAEALVRLARRDHSEADLRRALGRAGHDQAEVEAALERLRGRRFVDDASYAERFARSRLEHAGLGSRRVKHALLKRGVARPLAERGVKAAAEQVGEADVLARVARAYWRGHPRDEPEKRLRKLWGFLLRRGFPPALVREVLAALWPRPFRALPESEAPEADLGDNPED